MCLSYHYEQSVWITKPKVLYSPHKTLKVKNKTSMTQQLRHILHKRAWYAKQIFQDQIRNKE